MPMNHGGAHLLEKGGIFNFNKIGTGTNCIKSLGTLNVT